MANVLRQPPTNMKAVHAPAVSKHHILNPTYDRVDPTYLPPQPDMGLPSMKFAPPSQTPITEPQKDSHFTDIAHHMSVFKCLCPHKQL